MTDCLFCGIVAGDIPAELVAETDRTIAFRDIQPQARIHVLVVPRRHIENAAAVTAADADDLVALVTTARAVAEAEGIAAADRGYRLVMNVGPDALNSVPHLHLHVLGGQQMAGLAG
ncbi:MAG TPA: HIT domain-containing protein [Acidimicrobiales bacterium]|jgi:histidine triad (HIT) family protein